ncbi:MAG: HAD family hydrolase [Clostridia bacterium]|nr:HAD family hydrolase [Clostridia bacterium]
MKYQAVLFDLDGTLLPMDFDEFTRGYFSLLATAVAPLGYEKSKMIGSMWQGVAAMTKNCGPRKNDEVFWEVFSELEGKQAYDHIPLFDTFYENEFHQAKALTQPTPNAKVAVDAARACAERVVLATNPLFPAVAVRSRLAWAGLSENDFDLVTHYSNSTSSKPNPRYFEEIAEKLDLMPSRCLMVGNNADEDILPAQAAGFDTFLLTDCLMSKSEILPKTKKGSWGELMSLFF